MRREKGRGMIRKEEGREDRREEKKDEIGYLWVKEKGERLCEGKELKQVKNEEKGSRVSGKMKKKVEEGKWMMEN